MKRGNTERADLRIAFLTPEFVTEPYFAGGLAQYLGRVVTGLTQRGHEVEVFVTAPERAQIAHEGALVHRVPPTPWVPLRLCNLLLRAVGSRPLGGCQGTVSIARALNRALRERNAQCPFDVVQASSWMVTGLFAVRRPVAPIVIRLSSYGPLFDEVCGKRFTFDLRNMHRLEMLCMRRAAAVYAPSRFLAEETSKTSGIRVHVVRPPICSERRDADDASHILSEWPRYLLFFGRALKRKGAQILAEAVTSLLPELPDLHLAIAGADCRDDAARRLLALPTLYPLQVRYLGVLRPDQLGTIIRNAYAVVLPSLIDNLPNACLEAMSFGRIVIGPNGVSFDELIEDGKSGLLFQLGSVQSLRDAIRRSWGMSQAARDQMGQAARRAVEKFAPDVTLASLESFFEDVVGRTRARRR